MRTHFVRSYHNLRLVPRFQSFYFSRATSVKNSVVRPRVDRRISLRVAAECGCVLQRTTVYPRLVLLGVKLCGKGRSQ